MKALSPVLGLAIILAPAAAGTSSAQDRSRVLVLTDIGSEPDDQESLVRFLAYANEYDVEGLVASTGTWWKARPAEHLIRRTIDAYGQVRTNLSKHATGFPTAEQLRAVTTSGQPGYGIAAVGAGKGSGGSRLIVAAADRDDPRPLWVSVWGGPNTLAQALSDVRESRGPEGLKSFIAKLRVYTISDQDDSAAWIRREFPDLFYIVSPSTMDGKYYGRATWTGISGDRLYKNGPMHRFALVDNPWLKEHITDNHGPLGALYPPHKYIMEGDTPSFLGLINNGLRWSDSPAYGGWGGRYALCRPPGEPRDIWSNNRESRDTVTADNGKTVTSDQATIWRWREHYQNDFAARMDWCVKEYRDANHPPVPKVKGGLDRVAKAGQTVRLEATATDPDGDKLTFKWWQYAEADSVTGTVTLASDDSPDGARFVVPDEPGKQVHIILEVTDDGTPALTRYQRVIVTIDP